MFPLHVNKIFIYVTRCIFVYKSDHAAVLWLSPEKEHAQVNIFF